MANHCAIPFKDFLIFSIILSGTVAASEYQQELIQLETFNALNEIVSTTTILDCLVQYGSTRQTSHVFKYYYLIATDHESVIHIKEVTPGRAEMVEDTWEIFLQKSDDNKLRHFCEVDTLETTFPQQEFLYRARFDIRRWNRTLFYDHLLCNSKHWITYWAHGYALALDVAPHYKKLHRRCDVGTLTPTESERLSISTQIKATNAPSSIEVADIDIGYNICHNLNTFWQRKVNILSIPDACVRLWRATDCNGESLCVCGEAVIDLHKYASTQLPWNGQVRSISDCFLSFPTQNWRALSIYSEKYFTGSNRKLLFMEGECVSFYTDDWWHSRVVSLRNVTNGCIDAFTEVECKGDVWSFEEGNEESKIRASAGSHIRSFTQCSASQKVIDFKLVKGNIIKCYFLGEAYQNKERVYHSLLVANSTHVIHAIGDSKVKRGNLVEESWRNFNAELLKQPQDERNCQSEASTFFSPDEAISRARRDLTEINHSMIYYDYKDCSSEHWVNYWAFGDALADDRNSFYHSLSRKCQIGKNSENKSLTLTLFDYKYDNSTIELPNGKCKNLNRYWNQSVYAVVTQNCIRIWEHGFCSGQSLCLCSNHNLGYAMKATNVSWTGHVSSISRCMYSMISDEVSEVTLYTGPFSNGRKEMYGIATDECLSFYSGYQFHPKIASINLTRGECIEYFSNSDCCGISYILKNTMEPNVVVGLQNNLGSLTKCNEKVWKSDLKYKPGDVIQCRYLANNSRFFKKKMLIATSGLSVAYVTGTDETNVELVEESWEDFQSKRSPTNHQSCVIANQCDDSTDGSHLANYLYNEYLDEKLAFENLMECGFFNSVGCWSEIKLNQIENNICDKYRVIFSILSNDTDAAIKLFVSSNFVPLRYILQHSYATLDDDRLFLNTLRFVESLSKFQRNNTAFTELLQRIKFVGKNGDRLMLLFLYSVHKNGIEIDDYETLVLSVVTRWSRNIRNGINIQDIYEFGRKNTEVLLHFLPDIVKVAYEDALTIEEYNIVDFTEMLPNCDHNRAALSALLKERMENGGKNSTLELLLSTTLDRCEHTESFRKDVKKVVFKTLMSWSKIISQNEDAHHIIGFARSHPYVFNKHLSLLITLVRNMDTTSANAISNFIDQLPYSFQKTLANILYLRMNINKE